MNGLQHLPIPHLLWYADAVAFSDKVSIFNRPDMMTAVGMTSVVSLFKPRLLKASFLIILRIWQILHNIG